MKEELEIMNYNLLGSLSSVHIVWIGEIHGVRENYKAHKSLLRYLSSQGFRNLLWEMDEDFNEESKNSEDGRVNSFSIDFLTWIRSNLRDRTLHKLTLIGSLTALMGMSPLARMDRG